MLDTAGRKPSHTPGLTPLKRQYLDRGGLFACRSVANPLLWTVSNHDISDSTWVCTPYHELVDVARLQYYTLRGLEYLGELP